MGTPKTFSGPGPKPLKHFPSEPAKLDFNFEISIFFALFAGLPHPNAEEYRPPV